jgi:hypothetical protein
MGLLAVLAAVEVVLLEEQQERLAQEIPRLQVHHKAITEALG